MRRRKVALFLPSLQVLSLEHFPYHGWETL